MTFKEWFNKDDHDLYNFPEEAMELAWNEATKQQQVIIDDLREKLSNTIESTVDLDWLNN